MPEGALKAIRGLDKAMGNKGIEVTVGNRESGGIKSYFTNKLPPLRVESSNAERSIKVEVSSIEQDNNELLHYLFRKTIESE